MSLANVIRSARERARLSQDELAKRVGVSRQAVQQWETGKTGPKRKVALKVAQALNLPASAIDPMSAASVSPIQALSDQGVTVPMYALAELLFTIDWSQAIALPSLLRVTVDPDLRHCFAVRVEDDSMAPDFYEHDVVIVDPKLRPQHQDDVVVAFDERPTLLRRYINRGVDRADRHVFDLTSPNADCITLTCHSDMPVKILGVVVEVRRRVVRR